MFYIVSKILKFFLLPMTWVLGLLVLALFIKDKKRNRLRVACIIASAVFFLLFSNRPLFNFARYLTTKSYLEQKDPQKYYPVAIVMGGFGNMNCESHQFNSMLDRGGRLYEAIRLQRLGIVGRILVTGDACVNFNPDSTSSYEEFRSYVSQYGVPKENILAEQHARNTRENATYTIPILDSLGYCPDDCLLITSASHMQRSLACFSAQGWNLTPYAVNIYPPVSHLQVKDFMPVYHILSDWQELMNEWFGLLVYKVMGYN